MFPFRCVRLWLMFMLSLSFPFSTAAQERFALVIGNSRYEPGFLRNPARDADAMEEALTPLGFRVFKHKDLDRARLEAAVRGFRRSLTRGSVAFFFYSGHGLQDEGENYLVPVGTRVEEQYEIAYKCVPVSLVLRALQESESHLNVVVLDSCRNNPFQRTWTRSVSDKGLAVIGIAPRGTLIAFATAPGKTAADGTGNNSPYTRHLCEALRSRPTQGLLLREVFFEASRQVKRETGQIPWLNMEASLDKFYLWSPAHAAGTSDSGRASPAEGEPWARPSAPPRPPALPKSITNSLGMQLVLIPAGEFLMGSPNGERGHKSHESPQHRVRITRSYYLGIHEVTQQQYQAIMRKNPASFLGADLPVEGVSWEDAVEFCQKLSECEDKTYRLPTEAEWEYACRAGTKTAYAFGSTLSSLHDANFDGTYALNEDKPGPNLLGIDLSEMPDTDADAALYLKRPAPVGSYRANAWGLYDMHGNVSEWCADWFAGDYYGKSPTADPPGPPTGSERVSRGGEWYYSPAGCRSAYRDSHAPSFRSGLGFRVALVAEE